MGYNKDTDYQALIDAAVKKGDYKSAAQYEQQRNEKITALNATGGNKYNATTTNNYSGWLDNTDYGTIGKQQMMLGASAEDVLDTYNNRYNKANGTVGLQQYANDDLQAEMWDYIQNNWKKEVPTFSFDMGSKPTYESQYMGQINALAQQLINREPFSYDHTKDPLYQQYEQKYLREGDRAMRDTLAEAASGAGGMNSYAITAAQQANNYYASQLADKIPELQQLAYQMYLDDQNMDRQDIDLLLGLDNTQYGRYRDDVGDWYSDRDFAYGQYRDNVGDYQWGQSFDYQKDRDAVADAWKEREWDYGVTRDQINDAYRNQEWDYGLERDALSDSRYDTETAYDRAMTIINAGSMPSAELLAQAGLDPADAQLLVAAVKAAMVKKSSGGGGSGGSSGNGYKSKDKDDDDDGNGYTGNTSTGANDPYIGTAYENTDKNIWNRNGSGYGENKQDNPTWIEIPGKGRFTIDEIQAYVKSGQVIESKTADGLYMYEWNYGYNKKKSTSSGGGGGGTSAAYSY